jgi:hypothetical protein
MQIHLMTIARHLHLQFDGGNLVEFDVGVNLRNRSDFLMTPQIKVFAKSNAIS